MTSRLHIITLLALAACSRSRRTPDDKIVVVIESAITTPDPRYAISNHDSKVTKLIGSALTAVDTESLEPRFDLATKMEPGSVTLNLPFTTPVPTPFGVLPYIVVVPVPCITWDITIRDDARFSDGAPLTADDVAFTYNSVLGLKSTSLHHKGFTERYWSVTAVNPHLVRLVLKQPLATLLSDLDFTIVSAKTGLGSGPYLLRELTDAHALFDENPYYYGPKPKTAHIEFKFVRDAAARLLMLVGGSADVLQNSVRLDLIDHVIQRPRVKMQAGPSVILTYLMMNNDDPILKDHRVREAIALAIDRRSIMQSKFGGRARIAQGLLPEMHWAYAKDLAVRERDLARAKQLLDEAGYRKSPRMTLVYKTSSDAFRISIARMIAAQLGDVGIAVEVRPFEFATFFADVKKGTYQLASMQSAELNEPDYYYFYFHSSRIPDAKNPDGGNRWRYRNKRLDYLVEHGRQEPDKEKRKVIYAEAQHIVADDIPIVPLWHEDNVVLTNVDLKGYTLTPNARYIGLANASKSAP